MKKSLLLFSVLALSLACTREGDYKKIDAADLATLTVKSTLVTNKHWTISKVSTAKYKDSERLLVKINGGKNSEYYLFSYDCEMENDSTILAYAPAFLIDENGGFQKNGLWLHAEFYVENENFGIFKTKGTNYRVDSIPPNNIKTLPTKEGIYYFEEGDLILADSEQSETSFQNYKKNGFYFIPNTGRFFDRILIRELE